VTTLGEKFPSREEYKKQVINEKTSIYRPRGSEKLKGSYGRCQREIRGPLAERDRRPLSLNSAKAAKMEAH